MTARPPIRTRAKQVILRVTPEELETLRAAASRSGLGVGPWLRSLGLYMAQRKDLHPLDAAPRRSTGRTGER